MGRMARNTREGRRQASRAADAAGKASVNSVAPAISGTARQGETLTCSTGTWSGSPTLSYQWLRNATPIAGATANTRVLAAADIGATMKCVVSAVRQGVTAEKITAATAAVAAAEAPVNTVAPSISGTAQVGQTLTASDGTWTGAPTPVLTRQWLADDVAIEGETGTTYVPVVGDIGAVITVTVTATNAADAVSETSAGTAAVIAA